MHRQAITALPLMIALLAIGADPSSSQVVEESTDGREVVTRRVKVVVADDDQDHEVYVFDNRQGGPMLLGRDFHRRSYLGISLLEMTPDLRSYFTIYTWMSDRQDRLDTVRDLTDERIPAGGTPGFATLNMRSQDPLLRRIVQLVMTDEAFHHKFGKIWADRTVPSLSEQEHEMWRSGPPSASSACCSTS